MTILDGWCLFILQPHGAWVCCYCGVELADPSGGFYRKCSSPGRPDPAHLLPEIDPYGIDDVEFILDDLCPACDRHAAGHCSPDPNAESPCARAGHDIKQMSQSGGSCPAMRW